MVSVGFLAFRKVVLGWMRKTDHINTGGGQKEERNE